MLKATLPPLITGVIILAITYLLSGAVSNGIQKQLAQVAAVKEMQPLLTTLGASNISPTDATATALTLSAYGPAAISPLLNILQGGQQNQVLAASEGLRAIGLANSAAACTQFAQVLRNRTRLFTWQTQREVIVVAGELGCDLKPLLQSLAALVERSLGHADFAPYAKTVQPSELTLDKMQKIQGALRDALQLMDQKHDLQSLLHHGSQVQGRSS